MATLRPLTPRRVSCFAYALTRLEQIGNQFLNNVCAMDATFISDAPLDELPQPSCLGKTRVGGIDINKPRSCGLPNNRLVGVVDNTLHLLAFLTT